MLLRSILALPFTLVLAYAALPVAVGKPIVPTLGVDALRPGMRGYGLTVFRGTEPERFDVEIIDVLHNFRPDQDLVLVRTEHPTLELATTVAGMSGSPIYIDGKLIGAYAYGWPFGREPVAGVTPISSMLAELSRPLRPAAIGRLAPAADLGRVAPSVDGGRTRDSHGARAGVGSRAAHRFDMDVEHDASERSATRRYLGERTHAFAGLDTWNAQRPAHVQAGPYALRASTPLLVGGMTDAVVGLLDQRLSSLGLEVLQAGGAQRSPRTPATTPLGEKNQAAYVDGGAVAVQLIRGDISATGVGTVTHVAGRRLVAFGHPMLNAGQIALPAATARVLHVLASDQRSFKIAEALSPIGTLVQDRQSTIVVDTDTTAPTIPMTIRVHGIDAPRTRWQVELASHRMLTPMLAFSAIASALGATAVDQDDVMYDARTRVVLSGMDPIEVRDIGYSPAGAAAGPALARLRLFDLMEVAYGNSFEPVQVESIEVDLNLRYARDVTEIVEASVASESVDPGRSVPVYVRLKPYAGPEQLKIVQVPIPSSAAGKEIELEVHSGDQVAVERPQPRRTQDLIRIVQSGHKATELAVSLKEPARGLSMRGHVVRALPGSALDALMLANSSERGAAFATETHHLTDMGKMLTGSVKLKLQVRETAR